MSPGLPKNLLPCDGEAYLWSDVMESAEADRYFERLRDGIVWRQESIKIFGRILPVPRLTAWHGDKNATYTYSGLTLQPQPWTPDLMELKGMVEQMTGKQYNSVLLNYYRSGNDSMGWHSDDEPELGENPVIASLSFGQVRSFHFRHKRNRIKLKIALTHGSLLLMSGATQHRWQHALPRSGTAVFERINLTFRNVRIKN